MPDITKSVDPNSCISIFIECFCGKDRVGNATGFTITHEGKNYLVTNWHVVTGKSPQTGKLVLSKVPDALTIWLHDANELGKWHLKLENLYDQGTGAKRWLERSLGKNIIDVIALPLPNYSEVRIYSLDLSLRSTDLLLPPSEPVSIVGFPFGQSSSGKFPIWKTGHIASDIDLDYFNLPVFLIDATTKSGMSGSPVFAKRVGPRQTSSGTSITNTEAVKFLGIYSGRIQNPADEDEVSDIGMVWKAQILDDILK